MGFVIVNFGDWGSIGVVWVVKCCCGVIAFFLIYAVLWALVCIWVCFIGFVGVCDFFVCWVLG